MPGDARLRHDIELLADRGILRGPVTTWPIPWPQIAADLADVPEDRELAPATAAALDRVRWQLHLNKRSADARTGVFARGGSDPQFLRSFDDTPRAEAETGAYVDWINDRLGGRLQLSYALDPADDREVRLDGSWIGLALGNWMLGAGWMDRHWGPAWQGGLIMSDNARPRAGLSLQRLRAKPYESWLLSWMGPWTLNFFVERLESDRAIPNTMLTGFRFAFRPLESLEIGLSRTAMFGGEGNKVDLGTIADVVTGQSNPTNPSIGGGKDINQLGGMDFRWRLPYINSALYGEMIGEDEKSGHPFKMLGQAGIEFWGGIGDAGASWRLAYERIDTKADIFGEGGFGIAYNSAQFTTGYRYRGRSIGHPADGDALLNALRAMFVTADGQTMRLVLTDGDLNRDGRSRNTLTTRAEGVTSLDLGYAVQFRFARLELGAGVTERRFNSSKTTKGHGWIGLSREFD